MFLKKRKASTDPSLRSLLQKAVRRGACKVVENTVNRLLALGDSVWLRSRAVVITFEEAWPLAGKLLLTRDHSTKLDALLRVCQSTKQKDAAGLGALAFAYSEQDRSMVDLVPSERTVWILSEALKRPAAFFEWLTQQCQTAERVDYVRTAQQYLTSATWGWDKATILAGALLAATTEIPELSQPTVELEGTFPYWVALDKHTPDGKEALHRLATKHNLQYRQLIWAGFYFESAIVNYIKPSPWFDCEKRWRLRKAGLTVESAAELWSRIRPLVLQELEAVPDRLRDAVECSRQRDLL